MFLIWRASIFVRRIFLCSKGCRGMSEVRYIVKKSQILNGVEWAIEQSISNNTIVRELMSVVENEIETILEDDCEEYEA